MRFFRYSPAVTKGLKKVTNLFQIGLFPHKKVKFAHFSTKQVCNVKKKNFQRLINVNSNFLIQMIEILVEQANFQNGGHRDVMYNNNAKMISQIPSSSNLLLKNRVFKLRGNQRFVYKSKMATKIRVQVANLKFDLQSESYRSILAIMHFCDVFYSKIQIIHVLFGPLK